MDSKRFPKKAIQPLLGKPLLSWSLTRLSSLPFPLVLATSQRSIDEPLVSLASSLSIPSFQGQTHNVLSRLLDTLVHFQWSWIVRISGDSPFIDPQLISQAIQIAQSLPPHENYIVTNLFPQRSYPPGFSVEVLSKHALLSLQKHTLSRSWQEHVSSFAYQNPHLFSLTPMPVPQLFSPKEYDTLSFTVDYPQDLKKLSHIASSIPQPLLAPWHEFVNASLKLHAKN
jgi:spore coat polysaccharide biosynthesis protein SpsF